MANGIGFPDKQVMAELTAKMLIEVDAVQFMGEKPYIYTSGLASPVYTDCRRLILAWLLFIAMWALSSLTPWPAARRRAYRTPHGSPIA